MTRVFDLDCQKSGQEPVLFVVSHPKFLFGNNTYVELEHEEFLKYVFFKKNLYYTYLSLFLHYIRRCLYDHEYFRLSIIDLFTIKLSNFKTTSSIPQ